MSMVAFGNIESKHFENYAEQKWWVGKSLSVGDTYIYKLCDPDAYSGLYGGRPWDDRCYYIYLHFVTLLQGAIDEEWIVQVMIVDESGNREYDIYKINSKTMRIDGLAAHHTMAYAIQNSILHLTQYTNKEAQPLIVGETWGGVETFSSHDVKFIVRDVSVDENNREIFYVGHTAINTSIHAITLDEPFPLGADVYDSSKAVPVGVNNGLPASGVDRIYSYELIWSDNSLPHYYDKVKISDWFSKFDLFNVNSQLKFPAGYGVVDFCRYDGDADENDYNLFTKFNDCDGAAAVSNAINNKNIIKLP